jgi:hypothetical protein
MFFFKALRIAFLQKKLSILSMLIFKNQKSLSILSIACSVDIRLIFIKNLFITILIPKNYNYSINYYTFKVL